MATKKFHLIATVSTDNPSAIRTVLKDLIGNHGTVERVGSNEIELRGKGEFRVQAQINGENARDINRALLSALRKAERRTRLRAAWSSGKSIEQYFDYVLRKTTKK